MSNIISSDFYRVRKGAALRNTCLGLAAIVIVMLVLFMFMQSHAFASMITTAGEAMPAEMEDLQQEIQSEMIPINDGADFISKVQSEFVVFFFFLPITLAVFCADFTAGTYRNTLSYESDRVKVYMSKLLLSVALCLGMLLGMLLLSFLLGGIFFGFSGFTSAFLGKLLTSLLLQLPIYLATVAVCHCLVAFTRKSSSTIALFLVGYFVIALATQMAVGFFSLPEWIMLFDPQTAGKLMTFYDMASKGNIAFVVIYNLGITSLSTFLGVEYYKKTDMP